jgi:hypothetical protein
MPTEHPRSGNAVKGDRPSTASSAEAQRVAGALVVQHGLNAAMAAALQADAAAERGDATRQRYWSAALRAVRQMTAQPRGH